MSSLMYNSINEDGEYVDTPQGSRFWYWTIIMLVGCIAIFVIGWFVIRLSYKMGTLKEAFIPFIKRVLIITALLVVVFLLLFALFNILGKQKEIDRNSQKK